MSKHSTEKPEDIELAPPPVEGRLTTQQEFEVKQANGRYYLDNVWRILTEYPSNPRYDCRSDLPGLVNKLYAQVRHIGYALSDESARLDGVKNCLELAEAWAKLCRDARTSERMFIVRRTPENSGAVLMIQRIEHLRGQVTEMAPLAYIAIVRDDQLLVTRDRVLEQEMTERVLLEFAKMREDCVVCQSFIRKRQSTVLPCGHHIHSDCYAQFIEAGHTHCPACHSSVEAARPATGAEGGGAEGGGAHARLVAAAKPLPLPAATLPQAQRPPNMTDEMFNKQLETVRCLMAKLHGGEKEGMDEAHFEKAALDASPRELIA